ncbi:hypothetical protein LAZ67_10001791, partial [Cordylochernes scorpioides]
MEEYNHSTDIKAKEVKDKIDRLSNFLEETCTCEDVRLTYRNFNVFLNFLEAFGLHWFCGERENLGIFVQLFIGEENRQIIGDIRNFFFHRLVTTDSDIVDCDVLKHFVSDISFDTLFHGLLEFTRNAQTNFTDNIRGQYANIGSPFLPSGYETRIINGSQVLDILDFSDNINIIEEGKQRYFLQNQTFINLILGIQDVTSVLKRAKEDNTRILQPLLEKFVLLGFNDDPSHELVEECMFDLTVNFKEHTVGIPAIEEPDKNQAESSVKENNDALGVTSIHNTTCLMSNQEDSLLSTATIMVMNHQGKYQPCRALIDTASQATLITRDCLKKLNLEPSRTRVELAGIGGQILDRPNGVINLNFTSHFNMSRIFKTNALVVDKVTSYMPYLKFEEHQFDHLQGLQLADPQYQYTAPIDILLGADIAFSLFKGAIKYGHEGQPKAIKTLLGWLLFGEIKTFQKKSRNYQKLHTFNCTLNNWEPIFSLWEEELKTKPDPFEDDFNEIHFKTTHERETSGRYIVRLPFKDPSLLGESKPQAINCFFENGTNLETTAPAENMPKKPKSTDLGQKTKKAKSVAIRRRNETSKISSQRLLNVRQNMARIRANETPGETSQRLLEAKQSMAVSRANETQGETTERLLKARQYKSIRRAIETKGEATERLLKDRHNKAISRENETTEGTLQRLRLNRERASIILNNPDDKFKGYIIKGNSIIIEKNYLGGLTEICEHCYSKNFKLERPMDKKFNYCCQKGKLVHLHKPKYPVFLRNLLTENSKESKCFQKNIWKYNSTFAFASFGCAHSDINIPIGGPDIFKINGNIYHLTPKNIYPTEGNVPRYAQFYILDSQQALNICSANPANRNLDSNILRDISSFLTEHNILKKSYKMMIELEKEITKTEGIAPNLMLSIVENPFQDQRRYNAPRTNEIAAVFQNVDGEPPFNRDIRVYNKNSNETTNISILHQHLDAMTYPLLIPHAEAGWHSELKIPTTNRSVTQKMFYSNRFAIRDEFNQFLQSGKLVQIYAVDAYTKMEASRLHYFKTHQSKLRVDLYESLRKNYNHHHTEWNQIGNPIVLPSSFIGSSRNMQERYRDTMAIVRKYGKPDLFITMTCNPKWLEITENLNGSSVVNRPDIVSRVFNLKSKELIRDLIKNQIFGKVVAYVYTIEFQKRGLPHMHLLCILDDKSKPNNSDLIDKIIWAEIPEENDPSGLNPYVLKHMIHGPCIGSDSCKFLCLDSRGKCKKEFPKYFLEETIANLNGYPKYQRRNTGKSFKIENKNISVDNRWVVPYSPFLLKKYDCHINVQVCTSIKSVKYIFKYILKGHDCANLEIQYNEIKTYLNSRYVCAPGSMYRIFGFDLYSKSHKIERLPVHLEDMHSLVFEEQDDILEVINRPNNKKSMLTAYFDLNINDPEARNYTYAQIPEHYIYNKKERKYHKRSRGGQKVIQWTLENNAENQRLFCVDGPAGTGKTFLFQTLMCFLRGAGKIVLPCASTGIAATLLKGGRTYHSLFKLPIPLNEASIANFDKDSNLKNEIISSSLIIWDEISMAIGYALTAIDRKLRDVMRDERPFGGKVILFGGDFRQNLPVIKHGHPAQIIESTVKRNPLWCHVKSEKLTLNMRTKDEVIFAEYLLKVGEGELLNDYNLPQHIIEVPRAMISSGDLNSEIFGEKLNFNSLKDNPDRAILCPTNEDTFQINNALLDKLGGTFHHYVSIDFIDIQSDNLEQDQLNYPVEFLNSITLSGMPQHKLNIKVGAIVILLKNVNTKRGLCNGTRMIVTELKTNLIYCEVLSGPAKNEIVYIPRIDCSSGELDYPVKMIRRQFPIRISFAMTINKSQGQTFNKPSSLPLSSLPIREVPDSYRSRNSGIPRNLPIREKSGALSIEEIETSFNRIIRCAQQEDCYIDLKQLEAFQPLSGKSPLIKLNPFLDKGGLLRVGGRLNNALLSFDQKHPIILPKAHYITQLVIRHYHERLLHAGVQLTLSAIREKYWIPSGRCLVKQILFKCIKCARFRTKAVQQLMGNLPTSRTNWTRPFTKTGIDFAGPVIVKTSNLRNARCDKAYIALFICMFSKAIHIELVTNLTTEAFLAALRRFIGRRGRPAEINTDNATNFVGAYKDLRKLFNSNIHDFASSEEIKWNFIPPSSPHFGGLWEAGIKSVKYHLRRIVGKTKLTFEELTTVLTQIEACLNSRPLCPLTDDPEDLNALTAGHFLIGMPLTAVPSLVRESGSSLKGRWQLVEQIKTDFWKRWSCEYFSRLQNRPKWLKPVDNIKIGTLVLLKEDNLPPLKWRMGRINQVYPGEDGLVRVVSVKTADGVLRRAVAKKTLGIGSVRYPDAEPQRTIPMATTELTGEGIDSTRTTDDVPDGPSFVETYGKLEKDTGTKPGTGGRSAASSRSDRLRKRMELQMVKLRIEEEKGKLWVNSLQQRELELRRSLIDDSQCLSSDDDVPEDTKAENDEKYVAERETWPKEEPLLSQTTPVFRPAMQPGRCTNDPEPTSGASELAMALVEAFKQQGLNTERLMARQGSGGQLPVFSGNPLDWPVFIQHYRNRPRTVLEQRYGQPEYVVQALIEMAKKTPSPKEGRLSGILDYANAINNLVTTVKALDTPSHLQNPQLKKELVDKLPDVLRLQWGEYVLMRGGAGEVTLEDLSKWMNIKAAAVSMVTIPDFKKGRERDSGHHSVMTVVEPGSPGKCAACNEAGHCIQNCHLFRSSDIDGRWRMVKEKKLCISCLRKGHGIKTRRQKKVCGAGGYERSHHSLLHSEKERPAATSSTDTRTPAEISGLLNGSSRSVILRVIMVQLYGKDGKSRKEYAIFDECSSVTMMDADLANQLRLRGRTDPLRLKWTDGRMQEDFTSRRVSCEVGPVEDRHRFSLNNVRTVQNLCLPAQPFRYDELCEKWNHLNTVKIPDMGNIKPRLLIGQPHIRLTAAREIIEGTGDSPILTKTHLGWLVHGPTGNVSGNGEISFSTFVVSDEDFLHDLVKENFKIESIGVRGLLPRSKQDLLAELKMNELTRRVGDRWETGLLWKRKLNLDADVAPRDISEWSAIQTERVLGLYWDPKADAFTFQVNLNRAGEGIANGKNRPTKREVLRLVMLIFDPLGFILHYTMKARILLQHVWKSGIGWDDEIPTELWKKWLKWIADLPRIAEIRIPRCYAHMYMNSRSVELHVMADASEAAMIAAAYLRAIGPDGVEVSLVMSRGKVTPLKSFSIPRLELQAALIASRMGNFIMKEMDIRLERVRYWSDSQTVLKWIRSESGRFQQFVGNRVGAIHELTDVKDWMWVSTKMNVADDATREGKTDLSSESRWLRGPEFLRSTTLPEFEMPIDESHSDLELKKEFLGVTVEVPAIPVPVIEHFSKYMVAVRATMQVMKFIGKMKYKRKGVKIPDNVALMEKAKRLLFRKSQWDSYPEEMAMLESGLPVLRNSKLFQLSPVLDDDGVLLMDSRLANVQMAKLRTPIILDPGHYLTKLIIRHYHVLALHQGQETVRNEIRQLFWIPNLRVAIRRCWSECPLCRIRRAKPSTPMMAALPGCRVEPQQRSFSIVGMDYFGPMEVSVGRRHEKRYGVLFTCMTTRAIHLEVAHSLTTDSCIMAIRRMICRRGLPLEIFSDNGTNLRGADKELQQALDDYDQEALTENMNSKGIKWNFIPPSAPHMGGSWERLVRSVKTAISVILRSCFPKDEELLTLMLESEAVVNSRPLTDVPLDPAAPEAITPMHFLIGTSSIGQPPGQFNDADLRLNKRWRKAQRLADMFWMRWRKEYLPTLQRRTKWHGRIPDVQVGDMVLVLDESLRRGHWPLGIVEKVFPGSDKTIHVAEVKTSTGRYRRPVVRLAKLDLKAENGFRPEIGGKY